MSPLSVLVHRPHRFMIVTLLALLSGCGPSSGVLEGRVTVDGSPLANGILMVHDAGGGVRSTPVLAGSYELEGVPLGQVRITIRSLPPPPMIAPPPASSGSSGAPVAAAPALLQLPESLADADQSGLQATVVGGRQRYDLDLSSGRE